MSPVKELGDEPELFAPALPVFFPEVELELLAPLLGVPEPEFPVGFEFPELFGIVSPPLIHCIKSSQSALRMSPIKEAQFAPLYCLLGFKQLF
jgi:hypothetical protein